MTSSESDPKRKQSGGRIIAPPTFDDKTALGFLSDQLARERLRDFKLRSPEDHADSNAFMQRQRAFGRRANARRPRRKPQPPSFLCMS